MRRLAATIALGTALLLMAACGDDAEDRRQPEGDVAADPTEGATADRESPTPTSAIDASIDRDPREVLVELIQDPEEPDLELVYQSLSERFRVLEFDEFWVRGLMPSMPAENDPSVEDFLVEAYEGYSVVRHRKIWPAKYVFITEDGEWRFDPGHRRLLVAAAQVRTGPDMTGSLSIGMGSPDDYEMEWESSSDHGLARPLVQVRMDGVGVRDGAVDVAMTWDIRAGRGPRTERFDSHLLQDTSIPLDSISWRAGERSGEVDVRWTNGALVADDLVLKGWPSAEKAEVAAGEDGHLFQLRNGVTVRLFEVPEDAEEIALRFDEIPVGPLGADAAELEGSTIDYSYEFTFPAETTAPILVGEPPEPHKGVDADTTPALPSDQDLPPSPEVASVLEIVEAGYEPSGNATETTVTLDSGGVYFEFPGPVRVTWDDGSTTDGTVRFDGDVIEVTSERSEAPIDAEVTEIEFEHLVRSLGRDEDATFHEDRIETAWGDFPIIEIVDEAQVRYQPLGGRWLRGVTVDHDGSTISISGSGAGFGPDFEPTDARLDFGPELGPALADLPLPADLEVWSAESAVSLDVP